MPVNTPRPDSLQAHAATLSDAAMGLLRARLDLASLELAHEREKLLRRVAWLVAGVLLLVFMLLGLGALCMALLWDSHRVLGVALPTAVYGALGWWMLRRSQSMGTASALPFAATIAEFDKDRALLGSQLGSPGETAAPENAP